MNEDGGTSNEDSTSVLKSCPNRFEWRSKQCVTEHVVTLKKWSNAHYLVLKPISSKFGSQLLGFTLIRFRGLCARAGCAFLSDFRCGAHSI